MGRHLKITHSDIMIDLIRKHHVKIYAEIGVKVCVMLKEVMCQTEAEIQEYWAIDQWKASDPKNQEMWDARYYDCCNLITCYPNLKVLRADSIKATRRFSEGYFDAIFLDTTHKYNRTRDEIRAWTSKIKKGGIFAGHDFETRHGRHPGDVKKAVEEAWGTNFDVVPDGYGGVFIKYL